MKNETYDILKKIAQIWLPAATTLYFALAQIWHWPFSEQIVGSLTALDAFMGACLGVSTMIYNKGKKDESE